MASSHSNSFVKQSTVKRGIILGAILLLLILILHVGNPMMLSHKIKLAPTALRSPPTSARTACTAIVQDIVWRYPDTALIFFIFDFNCSATLSFAVSYVPKRAQTDSRASSGLCRSHNLDCSSDSPEWVISCTRTPCTMRNVRYDKQKHFILRLQAVGEVETKTAVNHKLLQPFAHQHYNHQEQCSTACMRRNIMWGDCAMWEYRLDPGTISTRGCNCPSDIERVTRITGLCACCDDDPKYFQKMDSCVSSGATQSIQSNCFLFSQYDREENLQQRHFRVRTEGGGFINPQVIVEHPKGTIGRVFAADSFKLSFRGVAFKSRPHHLSWQNVTIDPWDRAQMETSSKTTSFEYPSTIKELQTKGKIEWTTMPNLPVTGRQDMGACTLYGNTVIIGGFQGGFCGGSGSKTKGSDGKYWHDQTSARLSQWLDAWAKGSGKETGQTPFQPRGFRTDTWMLESDLQHNKTQWKELPTFPGRPRQLSSSTSMDDVCYLYGGYSYTPIKLGDKTAAGKPKKDAAALRDGWALQRNDQGTWAWRRLPDLPGTVAGGGIAGANRKLYFVGGADYDANPNSHGSTQSFFWWTDRNQENPLTNNVLRSLDLDRLDLGWVDVNQFPGTPRMLIDNLAYSPLHHSLLLMGGVGGIPDHTYMSFFAEKVNGGDPVDEKLVYGISTVVDNWSLDLKTMEWKRLHDLPIGAQSLFRMKMLGDGRYALLAGGAHKYGYVAGRDMTIEKIYKGKVTGTNFEQGGRWDMGFANKITGLPLRSVTYNTLETSGGSLSVSKIEDGSDWCETVPGMNQCDCGVFCPTEMRCAGMLVYDTVEDKYYRTNPLPLNVNQPTITTVGNTITVLGGEANPTFLKNGRFVGIHPSLVNRGEWVVPEIESGTDSNNFPLAFRNFAPIAMFAWKQSCGKCSQNELCVEDLVLSAGVRCIRE